MDTGEKSLNSAVPLLCSKCYVPCAVFILISCFLGIWIIPIKFYCFRLSMTCLWTLNFVSALNTFITSMAELDEFPHDDISQIRIHVAGDYVSLSPTSEMWCMSTVGATFHTQRWQSLYSCAPGFIAWLSSRSCSAGRGHIRSSVTSCTLEME
jgi:hypothetical protein